MSLRSLVRRALITVTLIVVLAGVIGLAGPVRQATLGESPIHAWLELDAPQSQQPSGIFLSVKLWRVRFDLEWSTPVDAS